MNAKSLIILIFKSKKVALMIQKMKSEYNLNGKKEKSGKKM